MDKKKTKIVILYIATFLFFLICVFFIYKYKNFSQENKFAQCLDRKGFIMYGADWCQSCQNQKRMFGTSFEFINYVNCDFNKKICQDLSITAYPVWVFGADRLVGVQSLSKLTEVSGCN